MTIKVPNTQLFSTTDSSRVSIPAEAFGVTGEIWFEFPFPEINASDMAVALTLPIAMKLGADIEYPFSVSKKLADSINDIQDILQGFEPHLLSKDQRVFAKHRQEDSGVSTYLLVLHRWSRFFLYGLESRLRSNSTHFRSWL